MADRPTLADGPETEIEITPEMIGAASRTLARCLFYNPMFSEAQIEDIAFGVVTSALGAQSAKIGPCRDGGCKHPRNEQLHLATR
jgi:hypothetical protein